MAPQQLAKRIHPEEIGVSVGIIVNGYEQVYSLDNGENTTVTHAQWTGERSLPIYDPMAQWARNLFRPRSKL